MVPNFLVAFDENRDLGGLKQYRSRPKYLLRYNLYKKTDWTRPFACLINKKSEITWMGLPKDAYYYVGSSELSGSGTATVALYFIPLES